MDWGEDMYSNAWVFPRGMPRDGAAGPKSVNWTSKLWIPRVSSASASGRQ